MKVGSNVVAEKLANEVLALPIAEHITEDNIKYISDSICKIFPNDIPFQIWENQLCPPYPNCISKNSIGAQDTSECI